MAAKQPSTPPARGRSSTVPREKGSAAESRKARASSRTSDPQDARPKMDITARYYTRARLQRTCPLVVEAGNPPGAPVVSVRPMIPGAQVVPAEQRLEPGEKVTFHVTPLARGRLQGAQLEVQAPGQPALKMPLRMKINSQRTTWVLLLLTLLLPLLLAYYTDKDGGQLKGDVPRETVVVIPPPEGLGMPPAPGPDGPAQPPGGPGPRPGGGQPGGGQPGGPPGPRPGTPATSNQAVPPNWNAMTGKPRSDAANQGAIPTGRAGSPGELLALNIDRTLSRVLPPIPDSIRYPVADTLNSWGAPLDLGKIDRRRSILGGLAGGAYQFLCNMDEVRPAFILGAGLFALTVLSWALHWRRRGWSCKGLPLAEATPPETLAFSSPLEPEPIDLEPTP